MKLYPGILLKSTSLLDDTVFEKAVIFITEHNSKGATGFIINKLFARRLNELQELSHITDFPLYNGGPVNQEHLFFIHRRPDIIEEGLPAGNGIFFGGNFTQAVTAINNVSITEKDIKIFVGYCGWDNGELEEEVEEGSWEIVSNNAESIFLQ